MLPPDLSLGNTVAIRKDGLDRLISALQDLGFETIGPKVVDGVVTYAPISDLEDLPQGMVSEQEKGYYRLRQGSHKRYFDITPGAQSWKQFLFPPRTLLFEAEKLNGHWQETLPDDNPPKYAFIGVRPCELAAIAVQDKVFIRDDYTDPTYARRRENVFTLVVNCLHPSRTCFCVSMGTGPKAVSGFDLSLTELDKVFLVEIGSDAGLALMGAVQWEPASAYWMQIAQDDFIDAEDAMVRQVENPSSVPAMLMSNLDHPHWAEVAARCLSCTSCTLVCPTCFCWDTADITDLAAKRSRRERVWDSCFNLAYSAQAGGNTRPSTKSRYRQWLSHKFGSWPQQFGTLGCIGCGRCITWCPAKIDITEEIQVFQEETS